MKLTPGERTLDAHHTTRALISVLDLIVEILDSEGAAEQHVYVDAEDARPTLPANCLSTRSSLDSP